MPLSRRACLAGLSAAAVAPILASCASDSSRSASGGGAGSSPKPEQGAFPVTIEHKYGSATIESAPRRVVTVGLTEQDTLLALGVVPVGVTYWFGDESLNGVYPWARDALGDAEPPELLRNDDGIQVERIAGLAPDLVIAQYSGLTREEYDTLGKLGVPVLAPAAGYSDYGMPWDEMARNVGTAVGQPEAVQQLIDDVKQRIADEAAAHPEFRGTTAAVVTPYDGLGIYGSEDPRSRLLTELGFDLHPLLTEAPESEFYVSLSRERTSELGDIGVAVWLDLANDPQVARLFRRTEAHDRGRWVGIGEDDEHYYVAHSFVTPLSIPYVLDRYVPQLAAAVDGDPGTDVPTPSQAA